ncbi:NUDIX domain-containing protein [Virgibacillus halophilus]|uniref:NUDIX domain-containing protein n=1 Tax=Tigheibacillus halophilus TaxID=361280 RepID=A0ABU5C751_9BACI|nr:NUDIX domain-containing protein [Virgibacillus halophilus]
MEGAIREVKEELGLDLSDVKGELYFSGTCHVYHSDYWLFHTNPAIGELTFQKEEVIDAKWVDKTTYKHMLQHNEIVPTIQHFWRQESRHNITLT